MMMASGELFGHGYEARRTLETRADRARPVIMDANGSSKPLPELVYERLLEAICGGRLEPGTRLRQEIGRASCRERVLRLV